MFLWGTPEDCERSCSNCKYWSLMNFDLTSKQCMGFCSYNNIVIKDNYYCVSHALCGDYLINTRISTLVPLKKEIEKCRL